MRSCNGWGNNLAEGVGSNDRLPCPACGVTAPNVNEHFSLGMAFLEHVQMETRNPDGDVVGFRESKIGERAASADDTRGIVRATLVGSSPRGEENTLTVCRRLVALLNERGDSWGDAEPGDCNSDIDCIAKDARRADGELKIQVVRADIDRQMGASLARNSRVSNSPRLGRASFRSLQTEMQHSTLSTEAIGSCARCDAPASTWIRFRGETVSSRLCSPPASHTISGGLACWTDEWAHSKARRSESCWLT